MSLELALEKNTATMEKLIATWNSLTLAAKAVQPGDTVNAAGIPLGTVVDVKVEAPKPEKAAPTPTATVTATPAQTEVAAPTPATASPSDNVVYEDVAKAITATVKVDRARVVAALAKFGAAKGTELKPEQYADFVKELA